MTHILLVLSFLGGALGAFVFYYSVKKGALEDLEESKYLLFREDNQEE